MRMRLFKALRIMAFMTIGFIVIFGKAYGAERTVLVKGVFSEKPIKVSVCQYKEDLELLIYAYEIDLANNFNKIRSYAVLKNLTEKFTFNGRPACFKTEARIKVIEVYLTRNIRLPGDDDKKYDEKLFLSYSILYNNQYDSSVYGERTEKMYVVILPASRFEIRDNER